ncbi:MAG: SDR family oxidoreductase [Granulicella sp.]
MKSKSILITGVAGFIGSSIARYLVRDGQDVRGLDNLSTGNLDNIKEIAHHVDFHRVDLQDLDALCRLCEGVEVIFHEGALPSVPKSVLDPLTSHKSNIDGTLNLLLAAKERGVRRVVYAASSSAYGNSLTLPKHERMTPAPISPYAVQKLNGEQYMQSFQKVYGFETVCLRYFNVFGPFQAADSPYSGVIAKFITSMLDGVAPTICGDGIQSRDFTYISNVVHANMCAASASAETVSGKVYNVALGSRATLLEIYGMLAEIIGFKDAPQFAPARIGDVDHSLADITAASTDLGYTPKVSVMEGLIETVAWYRSQRSSAEMATRLPEVAVPSAEFAHIGV